MATVLDLITGALSEIGVLAGGETPSANDAAWCLVKLNRMLSSWNTRSLFVYCINNVSFPFGSSKQSYLIGRAAGADFVTDRPIRIEQANLVLVSSTPNINVPLWILNVDNYADLRVPALSSTFPTRLYYQPTNPNGTLWPWPYPTVTTNKLEIYARNQIAAFTAVGNTFSFPPGYEDAITYSLAEALCPSFGRQLTPELAALASKARQNIQGPNSVPPLMTTDIPQSSGPPTPYFNYLTGNFK